MVTRIRQQPDLPLRKSDNHAARQEHHREERAPDLRKETRLLSSLLSRFRYGGKMPCFQEDSGDQTNQGRNLAGHRVRSLFVTELLLPLEEETDNMKIMSRWQQKL